MFNWKRIVTNAHSILRLRILQNVGWLTSGQILGDITSFMFFILLANRFGPEGVGIYAYSVAIASVGRTIVSMGVDDFGVQEITLKNSYDSSVVVGKIFGVQIWLIILFLFLGVFYFAITKDFGEKALSVLFLTTYHLSAGTVRSLFLPSFAKNQMAGPAILDSGSRILAFIIGILFIFRGNESMIRVLIGFPISGLVILIGSILLVRRHLAWLPVNLNLTAALATSKKAWPFSAGEIIQMLYARIDVVMLSLIAGSAATGIYAAGLKFFEVSVMVIPLLAFALFPKLTKLAQDDFAGFKIAVATIIKGGLILCIILGWAIYVLVPEIIALFFSSQFGQTENVVKLFAFLAPVMGVTILADRLLLAAGEQVKKLKFQAVATGVNIVCNAILIPILIVNGAIIASMISFALNMVLVIGYLKNYSTENLLLRIVLEVTPLLLVGFLARVILISLHIEPLWASIVFLAVFIAAVVTSGFGSKILLGFRQLSIEKRNS